MQSVAQELVCHLLPYKKVKYESYDHGVYMIKFWIPNRGCARIFLRETNFVYFDPLQRRKVFQWEPGWPYVDQVLDKIL